jgi:LPXTG-motif cell wall-anchored protein
MKFKPSKRAVGVFLIITGFVLAVTGAVVSAAPLAAAPDTGISSGSAWALAAIAAGLVVAAGAVKRKLKP